MILSNQMYKWATDLFPLNRSLTGEDNLCTLKYLQQIIPQLKIKYFKSGTKVYDWEVPLEWSVTEAYIEDQYGNKIIDYKDNNLHLVSYSEPIDGYYTLSELKPHLHTLVDQPEAIPYKTSYYKRTWGFCLNYIQYSELQDIKYHVVIKSKLFVGKMHYGELIIKGKSDKEILLSTYICHPSMANNEISGIVVTTALAKELSSLNNYYTYRILFIPETIGSIAYLSRNSKTMINKTLAGLVITCVGDNNNYSFMPTRLGNTYSDLVAKYVLNMYTQSHIEYTYLQRGSDERQYCSPKINLPIVSIMRSKYGTYPEYHTSLDNLNFISKEGLFGAYEIIFKFLNVIEHDRIYEPLYTCEPQLGKRGLYNISSNQDSDDLINLIAYFDGKTSLLEICKLISCDFFMSLKIIDKLLENHLIQRVK